MNVVNIDKYPHFVKCLCQYCFFRSIVKKQYDHCKQYPNDITTIRHFYSDYPANGFGHVQARRFVNFISYILNSIIWYGVDRRINTNLYEVIYNYGYGLESPKFFEVLKEKLDAINIEIQNTLNTKYFFDKDRLLFSNYPIDYYFKIALRDAYNKSLYDFEEFKKSYLYSSFATGSFNLKQDLDSMDNKLNADYWETYTNAELINLLTTVDTITKPAGVDLQKIW